MKRTFGHIRWISGSCVFALALSSILAFTSQQTRAANGFWNVDAAGSWATAGDPPWLGSVVPGSTGTTNSTDIATFGFTLTAQRIVTVDVNRNIGGMTFSNTSANRYVFNGGALLISNGGFIQNTATDGAHQTGLNLGVVIEGDGGAATFTNNSLTASNQLSFGGTVSGVSTAGHTTILTLNGSNSGNYTNFTFNQFASAVGDGGLGGKLAIVKDGAATWLFKGAGSTFTGGVTLNAGTLAFGSNTNAFGINGTLTINGGTLMSNGATANTTSTIANPISVGADFTTSQINTSASGYAHVTYSGNMSLTGGNRTITVGTMGTYSGAENILDFSGVISNGGLTKAGAGNLTLGGNNTYNGATTVFAGTLILSGTGSINSSSVLTVASGATLTNNNATAVTCGSLALTMGATLSGSGGGFTPTALTLTADIAGGSQTLITLNTTLNGSGRLTMDLTTITAGTYLLTAGSGSFASTFGQLTVNSYVFAGLTGTDGLFNYTYDNTGKALTIGAVPEPSALALLALVAITILLFRRRKSSKAQFIQSDFKLSPSAIPVVFYERNE